jgi:hypothetical protein
VLLAVKEKEMDQKKKRKEATGIMEEKKIRKRMKTEEHRKEKARVQQNEGRRPSQQIKTARGIFVKSQKSPN